MPNSGGVNVSNETPAAVMNIAVGSQSAGAGVQPQGFAGVGTARKLQTARRIGLTGDAAGGAAFDGSADVNIYTAVERLTNEELEAIFR